MGKPLDYVYGARGLLAVVVLVFGGLSLVGGGIEHLVGLNDVEARAIAWFVATALFYLAGPRLRRNDMTLVCLFAAVGFEVVRGDLHLPFQWRHVVGDIVGVALAWLPAAAENMRRLARHSPYVSLADRRIYGAREALKLTKTAPIG